MIKPLYLTKLEVAQRQVETAIKLYFTGGDPVSIHTLAAAGRQVLQDLGKHAGLNEVGTLFEAVGELVRPEFQKPFLKALAAPENFFKHADKDPKAVHPFDPHESDFLLFDAIRLFWAISNDRPSVMEAYHLWSIITWMRPAVMNADLLAAGDAMADKLPAGYSPEQFFRMVTSDLSDLKWNAVTKSWIAAAAKY